MLAERFYSDFYEQIARLASLAQDGAPEALAGLEKRARAAPQEVEDDQQDTGQRKAKPKVAVAIGAELQQWLKSDWALNWARIDPTLAGVDLRPYVFVTRDKRSSLAGFVATSQLEALVETLMGPRMKLKSAPVLNSMRELSAPDSEEVFDAIRDRVLQGDIFDKRPQGIDGLVGLVKEQPRLQNRLLEFIRGLPVERLGGCGCTTCMDIALKGRWPSSALMVSFSVRTSTKPCRAPHRARHDTKRIRPTGNPSTAASAFLVSSGGPPLPMDAAMI